MWRVEAPGWRKEVEMKMEEKAVCNMKWMVERGWQYVPKK